MNNIVKDFFKRNDLDVQTAVKLSGLSQAQVYRLLNSTTEQLFNIKMSTKIKLRRVGLDLEKELIKDNKVSFI